jgi:hypothetical protein
MRPPVSSGTVFVKDHADVWNKEHTIGNAELASRLGSLASFDKRGIVFWHDDFSNAPLPWLSVTTGAPVGSGYSMTLSDTKVCRGAGALKVVSSDTNDEYVSSVRHIGGMASGRIGLDTIVTSSLDAHNHAFVGIVCYDGVNQLSAGIKLTINGIAYKKSTTFTDFSISEWTQFSTAYSPTNYSPTHVKLVIDVATQKYVRCIVGGVEYDLSSYDMWSTPSATPQKVMPLFGALTTASGVNYESYFDHAMLTHQEPE